MLDHFNPENPEMHIITEDRGKIILPRTPGAQVSFQAERQVDQNRNVKYTNRFTVADLFPNENPVGALKRELQTLTIEEYMQTVKDLRFPKKSEMREFMKICPCCMEEHELKIITIQEKNIFKNVPVEYKAEYFYCSSADETYADEQQISINDIAMKNAYRKKMGLLTSHQISAIRARYGISQSDLCLLLGWGGKTITRYESHQVQDIAHDTILRKLAADPEWFLQLLKAEKESLSPASYVKYFEAGTTLFEQDHDQYLKSAIMARYARTRKGVVPFQLIILK